MDARTLFTAIGSGITSFLGVTVSISELLQTEFSAIVGIPIGVLVGVVVFLALWIRGDELSPVIRRAATAYAAFGVAVLVFLVLNYVNIGRSVLKFEIVIGGSLVAAAVVYATLVRHDRGRR